MGLLPLLVVVVLLIIWFIVHVLLGNSKIESALQEAVCDILGCN